MSTRGFWFKHLAGLMVGASLGVLHHEALAVQRVRLQRPPRVTAMRSHLQAGLSRKLLRAFNGHGGYCGRYGWKP